MTRTEYLNQLEAYLMKLPQSDRIEAMDYFKELFDDAGPEGEEELIASLGSPKEAAHDILTTLLDKKINEEKSHQNDRHILRIALLALLAAPIGIPVGIAHGYHRHFYRCCQRTYSLLCCISSWTNPRRRSPI